MSRTPCPVCDFPLATDDDDAVLDRAVEAKQPTDDIALFSDVLCWSNFVDQHRDGDLADGVKHWRARALEAERRKAMGDSLLAGARIVARAAEARVEALEGVLRAERDYACQCGDDGYRMDTCPSCRRVARALLSATPPKPAPRPDATEALRVAMGALESMLPSPTSVKPNVVERHLCMGRMWLRVAGAYVAIEGSQCFDPQFGEDVHEVRRWTGEDFKRIEERFAAPIRAALELLRAHVEPTPLEAAVAEVTR